MYITISLLSSKAAYRKGIYCILACLMLFMSILMLCLRYFTISTQSKMAQTPARQNYIIFMSMCFTNLNNGIQERQLYGHEKSRIMQIYSAQYDRYMCRLVSHHVESYHSPALFTLINTKYLSQHHKHSKQYSFKQRTEGYQPHNQVFISSFPRLLISTQTQVAGDDERVQRLQHWEDQDQPLQVHRVLWLQEKRPETGSCCDEHPDLLNCEFYLTIDRNIQKQKRSEAWEHLRIKLMSMMTMWSKVRL